MGRTGRPRMMNEGWEAAARKIMEKPHATLRTIQNGVHCGSAMQVLRGTPESKTRWPWFFAGPDRYSIMCQLGRTKHPEAVKAFADRLCVLKPKAGDGIRMIRRWQSWFDTWAALAVIEGDPVDEAAMAELARKAARRP